jgi:hypothetical protein
MKPYKKVLEELQVMYRLLASLYSWPQDGFEAIEMVRRARQDGVVTSTEYIMLMRVLTALYQTCA